MTANRTTFLAASGFSIPTKPGSGSVALRYPTNTTMYTASMIRSASSSMCFSPKVVVTVIVVVDPDGVVVVTGGAVAAAIPAKAAAAMNASIPSTIESRMPLRTSEWPDRTVLMYSGEAYCSRIPFMESATGEPHSGHAPDSGSPLMSYEQRVHGRLSFLGAGRKAGTAARMFGMEVGGDKVELRAFGEFVDFTQDRLGVAGAEASVDDENGALADDDADVGDHRNMVIGNDPDVLADLDGGVLAHQRRLRRLGEQHRSEQGGQE